MAAPVVGSAISEPTAVASSSRPRRALDSSKPDRTSGIRETQLAKQQAVEEERQRHGVASSRHRRFQSVPGGPASSQDWKPVSEASLMAISSGWSR